MDWQKIFDKRFPDEIVYTNPLRGSNDRLFPEFAAIYYLHGSAFTLILLNWSPNVRRKADAVFTVSSGNRGMIQSILQILSKINRLKWTHTIISE